MEFVRETGGLRWLLLYRRYSPRYDNPFAASFSAGSAVRNEQGWLFGWRWAGWSGTELLLSADQARFPWRSFSLPMPSQRARILLLWRQRVTRRYRVELRYTAGEDQSLVHVKAASAAYARQLTPARVEHLRFHQQMRAGRSVRLAARFEMARSQILAAGRGSDPRWGWLLYWQAEARRRALRLLARVTFFETQDYRARLYQYEEDVPGVLKTSLLYGRGVRFFVVFRIGLGKHGFLSGKYDVTRYDDRRTVGSGWDEILSPARHRVTLQLDVRF